MSNNYEELARRAKNVNQPQDIRQTVRIVVTTPTGRIGHQVLDNVLDSTAAIRVIVRAIKGRRTPPSLRPGLVLNDAEGRPAPAAEAILRGAAALDPA